MTGPESSKLHRQRLRIVTVHAIFILLHIQVREGVVEQRNKTDNGLGVGGKNYLIFCYYLKKRSMLRSVPDCIVSDYQMPKDLVWPGGQDLRNG